MPWAPPPVPDIQPTTCISYTHPCCGIYVLSRFPYAPTIPGPSSISPSRRSKFVDIYRKPLCSRPETTFPRGSRHRHTRRQRRASHGAVGFPVHPCPEYDLTKLALRSLSELREDTATSSVALHKLPTRHFVAALCRPTWYPDPQPVSDQATKDVTLSSHPHLSQNL